MVEIPDYGMAIVTDNCFAVKETFETTYVLCEGFIYIQSTGATGGRKWQVT